MSIEQVNTNYIGWSGAEAVMNFMASNPDRFIPVNLWISLPISKLEASLPSDPKRDFLAVLKIPLTTFVKSGISKSIDPNRSFVFAYTTADSVKNLVESIKVELSRRLLELTRSEK